jgi:hypothetical protein
MLLKSKVAHEMASEMSYPANENSYIRWWPGSRELWQDDFSELSLGREMKTKAHKGLSTDFANNVFGLFVHLQLAPSTFFRVLFGCALARLLGLSTL